MKYRLSGGLLITEKGIAEKDILISDQRIEAIVDRGRITSSDYRTVDCRGNYVSAGFVDIHQHGGGGSDYMDGEADTYSRVTEAHLAHGTTSILPTTVSADKETLLKAVDAYKTAKKDRRIRCNLLGLHLEGRYISPAQAGAQKPGNIGGFDENEYREIIERADGHLKRWSVAPELPGAKDFAAFAASHGVMLSIAHSDADFDTVIRAYGWGFRHVTHLYSCTSTIVRRNGFRVLGIVEAAYYLDDMNVEIIADGCHLPSSLLAYVAKFKSHDRIAIISDAMRAAGQNVDESFLGSKKDLLPVLVEDGVAKLLDRSAFAGSVATSDRLVRNMVKSGVPLADAVRMMTVNPIRMVVPDVKKGELKEGFDADICVFDGNIRVKRVFCGGEIVVDYQV